VQTVSRRRFLSSAGSVAALAAGAFDAKADPLGLPIGCQVYPVRDALGKDFAGTLKQLASIGYKGIEMCSPPGYEKGGFAPLVGMKASEMKRIIHDAGLICESCHYQFREMKENLDERMAFAKELGLKQMVVASFGLRDGATLADWAKAGEELNRIGEKTNKAGLQAAFHNHNGEFKEIDGVLIYDKLMQTIDSKLAKMQFQVSVVSLGYQAADFFNKYPGRFSSIHLQDWSPTEKKQVAIGQGSVDWKKLFTAAKKGGVKNYFVELNMDALKPSYSYLHELKV
jgi:sugar phosphate isomerase/epimerase